MKQENINKDDIETNLFNPRGFKSPYTIEFKELDLIFETRYIFNDEPNMFVSGGYWAIFENKDEYLAAVEKVKNALETEFISLQKSGGDFNSLQSPNDSISWFAEDMSKLEFSALVEYTGSDRDERYGIIIKVSPRHPSLDIPR